MKKFASLGFLLLGAIGCTVGPDYQRPSVQIPEQYKEAPVGWKFASPNDECSNEEWWRVFNDSQLDALEVRLEISNQNIKAAFYQYMQARALVTQARAAYFPIISGFGSVTREKSATSSALSSTAVSGLSAGTGSTPTVGAPFTNYHLELDASWAPDIWGSVRRTVEGAVAGAQASAAEVAATRLLAQASLAQFYFELRGLDGDQKVLDDTVKNYQKLLRITQNQYKAGTASRANVLQAQSLLELAEVQAIDNGILRAQYEHAIAVLIGVPPAEFCIDANPIAFTPPFIPAALPSTLLERRPDIAQAERLVKQANAQIGVAIAAYFPVLTLTETGGYNATKLANLFSKPAQFWSLGAQLADTLFDGGLRSGQVEAACATLHQTVAQYRQTVLTAFQDVEDNLAALRILNEEFNKQKQAVNTATAALDVVLNSYKAGTAAFADVL
ncbi:MAG: RND transporter, partial [Gammaproteobacteria bacterium 39-13]